MSINNPKNPLVSIIMTTYNRAGLISATIESILSQTYANFELIIIDDYSTDNTEEISLNLSKKDSRIKFLRNKENIKLVKSLNIGLNIAKGKYIARADDDDKWINKDKLEKQISFLESNPEHVLVGTGAIVVNEKEEEIFRYKQPMSDKLIRSKILFGNPFIHSTVVFKRDILDKTGLYDENLKDAEDWDLWLRMGNWGKFYNIPSYDIYRFYGERGLSIKNRINISKTRLQLIKKYRKQYPFFIPAFLFNLIQRLYSFIPYTPSIDNFLFKIKRKVL